MNQIPRHKKATPPRKRDGYSCPVFRVIVEMWRWLFHKQVLPAGGGYGDQNPLLLEAFRVLGAADARKQEQEDKQRQGKSKQVTLGEKMPLL